MKGWRTLIINAVLVGLGPMLEYAGTVNWVDLVGPTWAVVAMAVVNMLLRVVTTTPIGKSG